MTLPILLPVATYSKASAIFSSGYLSIDHRREASLFGQISYETQARPHTPGGGNTTFFPPSNGVVSASNRF